MALASKYKGPKVEILFDQVFDQLMETSKRCFHERGSNQNYQKELGIRDRIDTDIERPLKSGLQRVLDLVNRLTGFLDQKKTLSQPPPLPLLFLSVFLMVEKTRFQ